MIRISLLLRIGLLFAVASGHPYSPHVHEFRGDFYLPQQSVSHYPDQHFGYPADKTRAARNYYGHSLTTGHRETSNKQHIVNPHREHKDIQHREHGEASQRENGEIPHRELRKSSHRVHEKQITFKQIDSAFSLARRQIKTVLTVYKDGTIHRNDSQALAQIINEATAILVKKNGFAMADNNLLTRINVSTTHISKYCPHHKYTKKCTLSRYREIDGSCNNLARSDWGKADTAYCRFIAPSYGDGITAPRLSETGKQLPSPRLVSTVLHKDEVMPDSSSSVIGVVWGQLLAHDILFTRGPATLECCKGNEGMNSECFPIEIPRDDYFFSESNKTCMNFVRSPPGLRTNCKLGPREQVNEISSVIDANVVYSNDINTIRKLRAFVGGKMKTYPAFKHLGLKDLLPMKTEYPDELCRRSTADDFCFFAGEARASEQMLLALLHTLLVREHNRLAEGLSTLNPHWSDEIIYQETRHIVAAIIQHITFQEWLPTILGESVLKKYNLTTKSSGYFDGYDKTVNPGIASGFSSAAFRFGHSQVDSKVERHNKNHELIGSQSLSTSLFKPFDLYKAGRADEYLLGMLNKPSHDADDRITDQVTNHLFEDPGKRTGLDLAALNIQRGRDHGIPSYNSWRRWCGLKPIKRWNHLYGRMANQSSIEWYQKLYHSPEDIDLWSGGLSEIHEAGSAVGPTFACIIGTQFRNLRVGDRFWYENSGWPSSFTPQQLQEIRKTSLSRLICDNSDDIESIQLKAMLVPNDKDNPRFGCDSEERTKMDISAWKDLEF